LKACEDKVTKNKKPELQAVGMHVTIYRKECALLKIATAVESRRPLLGHSSSGKKFYRHTKC
jgi:hypothetical protein